MLYIGNKNVVFSMVLEGKRVIILHIPLLNSYIIYTKFFTYLLIDIKWNININYKNKNNFKCLLELIVNMVYIGVIGNENKQMWFATIHSRVHLWESEVVFMEFVLFLIYALGISLTVNVALLTVISIMWTNKE